MINKYEININFLANKNINLEKATVYLNLNEEDDWIEINDDMLGSYELILLKIVDHISNQTYYLFAKNTNLKFEKNILNIETFSEKMFYEKLTKKINLKDKLSILKNKLNYLEAKQLIGLDINEFLIYKKLREEFYIVKMCQLINIEKRGE